MAEGKWNTAVKNRTLDIVVTVYNEPWAVVKPFFDMLEHQICADSKAYKVIVVKDGSMTPYHLARELEAYSAFDYGIVQIPHGGPAAARNAGLEAAEADWVMFCDCDDHFADVCSLSMILGNFPADYDLIWMKYAKVSSWQGKHRYINKIDTSNLNSTDGKLYRRAFLREKKIRFNTRIPYHYQYMFNAVVMAETAPFRIAAMTLDFYPYVKTLRMDGYLHDLERIRTMNRTAFDRDVRLCQVFTNRGKPFEADRAAMSALCDVYFSIYDPDREDGVPLPGGFVGFYLSHCTLIKKFSQTDLDVVKSVAEDEALAYIQTLYNEQGKEYYFANDSGSFEEWLGGLKSRFSLPDGKTPEKTPPEPKPQESNPPEPQPPEKENKKEISFFEINNRPRIAAPGTMGERALREAEEAAAEAEEAPEPEPEPAMEIVAEGSVHEPKVVVYCGTFNVYMNMVASLKSLLCTTPVDKVYFLIEDDVFPYDLPEGIVECINVKDQKIFPENGPNFANSWTWMCMMRAVYPGMFKMYDKVLSLDIDVVIKDNVSDLWDYDLTDYYMAGVPERQRQKSASDPMYVNFGVVMMNLKKMREDGIENQVVNALNTEHLGCPEQDAFNKACAGKILALPNDYNVTAYSHITGEAQNERIVHYAGQRFWRHYSTVKSYGDLGWDEVLRRQEALH